MGLYRRPRQLWTTMNEYNLKLFLLENCSLSFVVQVHLLRKIKPFLPEQNVVSHQLQPPSLASYTRGASCRTQRTRSNCLHHLCQYRRLQSPRNRLIQRNSLRPTTDWSTPTQTTSAYHIQSRYHPSNRHSSSLSPVPHIHQYQFPSL